MVKISDTEEGPMLGPTLFPSTLLNTAGPVIPPIGDRHSRSLDVCDAVRALQNGHFGDSFWTCKSIFSVSRVFFFEPMKYHFTFAGAKSFGTVVHHFPFARLHWVFISLRSCMQSLQCSVQADFNAKICFLCHRICGSTNSLTLALDSLEVLQVRQC